MNNLLIMLKKILLPLLMIVITLVIYNVCKRFYMYQELSSEYIETSICGVVDINEKRYYPNDNDIYYKVSIDKDTSWYSNLGGQKLDESAKYCVNKYWYYKNKYFDGYILTTGQNIYILSLILLVISTILTILSVIHWAIFK